MQTSPSVAATGDALLVASRALVGIAARSLTAVDEMTLPQFRALVVVSSREHVTVNELAAALDVHGSTATRLCDRLVRKRLLRRTPDTDDRRVVDLHLTAAGHRLVDRVTRRRRIDLAAIAARMTPAARASLLDGLREFSAAAGEPTGVDLLGWSSDPP